MGYASVKALSSVCGLFLWVMSASLSSREKIQGHLQREMWLKWNRPLKFSFSCLLPCCNQKWLAGLKGARACLVSFAFVVELKNLQRSSHHVWLSSLYLPPLIRVESLAHYPEVNEFNLWKRVTSIWHMKPKSTGEFSPSSRLGRHRWR